MIVDTHVHLDGLEKESGLEVYLSRAAEGGVTRMVSIGGEPAGNLFSLQAAERHPHCVRAAVGHDRDLAGQHHDLDLLRSQLANSAVVAVGETGLDYHYTPETRDEQMTLFGQMLGLATEFEKPVVVHSREADADTLQMLGAYVESTPALAGRPAVLHCFTGELGFAQSLVELGLMISFSGILTFKNADALRAVAKALPEECLLVETDAPYLAPVPMRGKQNEPAYVRHVAECLAELRGCSLEHIAAVTSENAARFFDWSA